MHCEACLHAVWGALLFDFICQKACLVQSAGVWSLLRCACSRVSRWALWVRRPRLSREILQNASSVVEVLDKELDIHWRCFPSQEGTLKLLTLLQRAAASSSGKTSRGRGSTSLGAGGEGLLTAAAAAGGGRGGGGGGTAQQTSSSSNRPSAGSGSGGGTGRSSGGNSPLDSSSSSSTRVRRGSGGGVGGGLSTE